MDTEKWRVTGFGPRNRLRSEDFVDVPLSPDERRRKLVEMLDLVMDVEDTIAVKFERVN